MLLSRSHLGFLRMVRKPTRRTVLKTFGASSIVGMAGCLGDSGSDGGGDGGSGSGESSDDYPSEPITHVVPYSPGGTYDTYARIFMPEMSKELGVNIPIENIPGSSAMRGATEVTTADPDGYTFGGMGMPNQAIRGLLDIGGAPPGFSDVTPLCYFAQGEYVIISNPDLEIEGPNDLADRYADGDLTDIGGHRGGDQHLAALILQSEGHLPWENHIEYQCGGPTAQAVASGEIPAGFVGSAGARPQVDSGVVDYVVSLSPDPSPVFPEEPGTNEAGWGEITGGTTQRTYYLPPETPDNIVQTLADGLETIMSNDTVQTWSERTGNPVEYRGPERTAEVYESAFSIDERVDLSRLTSNE